MKKPATIDEHLRELLAKHSMLLTEEERERQLISLAYGNAAMENPRITRAMIEASCRELKKGPKAP